MNSVPIPPDPHVVPLNHAVRPSRPDGRNGQGEATSRGVPPAKCAKTDRDGGMTNISSTTGGWLSHPSEKYYTLLHLIGEQVGSNNLTPLPFYLRALQRVIAGRRTLTSAEATLVSWDAPNIVSWDDCSQYMQQYK